MSQGSLKADILKQICLYKKEFIAEQKKQISQFELQKAAQDLFTNTRTDNSKTDDSFLFYKKLLNFQNQSKTAIIAEIKKASPSMGIILQDFNPQSLAKQYVEGGCCCVSVLTDEKFFMGSVNDLTKVLDITKPANTPVLQKDFIVDECLSKYRSINCTFIS